MLENFNFELASLSSDFYDFCSWSRWAAICRIFPAPNPNPTWTVFPQKLCSLNWPVWFHIFQCWNVMWNEDCTFSAFQYGTENTTCSLSCSLGRAEGLDLKSESVFLLCALQCQSTHCNLPKVAAIYAIKHVFNIPEPHCVCVFLAHSLALSHSLCLPQRLYFYLWVCVCMCVVSGNGPFRTAALSLFTGGSSLPLWDKADRK